MESDEDQAHFFIRDLILFHREVVPEESQLEKEDEVRACPNASEFAEQGCQHCDFDRAFYNKLPSPQQWLRLFENHFRTRLRPHNSHRW